MIPARQASRSAAEAAGRRFFVTRTSSRVGRPNSLVLWQSQHLVRSRDVASRIVREQQHHWNVVMSTERMGCLFSSHSRNQSTTVFSDNVVRASMTDSKKEEKERSGDDNTKEGEQETTMAASDAYGTANPDDKDNGDAKTTKNPSRAARLANASRAVAKRGGTIAKKGVFGAKDLIQKYGKTFVATYASLWFLTLSSVFAGLSSGVLDPATIISYMGGKAAAATADGGEAAAAAVTAAVSSASPEDAAAAAAAAEHTSEEDAKSTVEFVAGYLRKFSFTAPYAEAVEKNPYVANLAIAWITTKILEPVRFGIAIAIVPRIARAIGEAPPEDAEGDAKDEDAEAEEEVKKEDDATAPEESTVEKFVVEETKKQ